jgi:hypothetical protein
MKSTDAIHDRIQRLQERISLLEQKYVAEMEKHHKQRDRRPVVLRCDQICFTIHEQFSR